MRPAARDMTVRCPSSGDGGGAHNDKERACKNRAMEDQRGLQGSGYSEILSQKTKEKEAGVERKGIKGDNEAKREDRNSKVTL